MLPRNANIPTPNISLTLSNFLSPMNLTISHPASISFDKILNSSLSSSNSNAFPATSTVLTDQESFQHGIGSLTKLFPLYTRVKREISRSSEQVGSTLPSSATADPCFAEEKAAALTILNRYSQKCGGVEGWDPNLFSAPQKEILKEKMQAYKNFLSRAESKLRGVRNPEQLNQWFRETDNGISNTRSILLGTSSEHSRDARNFLQDLTISIERQVPWMRQTREC